MNILKKISFVLLIIYAIALIFAINKPYFLFAIILFILLLILVITNYKNNN